MPDPIWYHIRSSRSQPPGLAGSDSQRARTYVAALEQFEELMEASATLSAPSRPLTMFYALAQAGQAIVAAHFPKPPPRSHGLTLPDPGPNLMATAVQVHGNGWYQAVSEAVASPLLQKAELGQLWAAIPDLARTPLPPPARAKALRVVPVLEGPLRFTPAKTAVAHVLFDPMPMTPEEAADRLRNYPQAAPAFIATVPGTNPPGMITSYVGSEPSIRVHFSLGGNEEPLPQLTILESRAPEYRFYDHYWLVPAMSEGQVLSPLMLWWALLFGLSMLARYHPNAWVAALEVNRSDLAVPLEDALDMAQSAVPHLVLEALLRKPIR